MPCCPTASRVVIVALVAGCVSVLSTQTGCDSLATCHSTTRSAGESIITAWCQRYVECDPKRGTVDDCVANRISIGQVPTADGCGQTCAEDDSTCRRSSCDDAKIDKCKTDSRAMKCDEQASNMLVRFPLGCDSCFNN